MAFDNQSVAAANAVGVKNVQFKTGASVLARKLLIIATYDPAKTDVVDEVPVLITSPEDAGSQFGFGFMAHRLAVAADAGSRGIETYVIPQSELGGSVAADGSVDFTGSTGVLAGIIYIYIAGLRVPVSVNKDDADTVLATKVVAAINADNDLPVTSAVDGGTPAQVNFTSKTQGTWGNDISITFNWGAGEVLPVGVVAVVVDMANGAGVPDIADALDGLGTGDNQNLDNYTDVIHGYGQSSVILDAISDYNGAGNDFVGNYSKLVARPFRTLTGDVAPLSAALTALLALANSRKLDRTNGVIAAPGSPNHPSELAAVTMGVLARINNTRAEETIINQELPGIIAGVLSDQWSADYDNRNLAVTDGVSTTLLRNGVLTAQNVLTFYHPDSVPLKSNGYRSQRNISINQNMLNATKLNFERDKWQGITIVEDVSKVANVTSRLKARDVSSVIDDYVALAKAFEGLAWLFNSAFTIEELKDPSRVTIRPGGIGFDARVPVVLSGEGGILNTEVEFDTDLAIILS